MTVTIIITEDMIQCFNHCARTGEYQPFLQDYFSTIQTVIKHLKSASFPKELVCTFVSMHLKECVSFLSNNDSKPANFLLRRAPALYEHMRYSIHQGNWTCFYWDYRPKFDYMIEKARNQKVINFQIEFQGAFFDSFESRDMAGNYRKPDGRCLPDFSIPTPILTQEKNVCRGVPVQKEKLKELDTSSISPEADLGEIEKSGTGQSSKSAGPTRTSLTAANSAAVAADIMNSVTEAEVKNEQMIKLFESELDPEKTERMKMRELKNMMKDLKLDFADHKNQVEQKLTEQTTRMGTMEKSLSDQITELKSALNLKDEQSKKQMDQLMNMVSTMMKNSLKVQTNNEQVEPTQNNTSALRTEEPSSGTLPMPIANPFAVDFEQYSLAESGFSSMPSSYNTEIVGSLRTVQTDTSVPTGNLIDLEGSSSSPSAEEFEEDEGIRKMNEEHEIKLAEQKLKNDVELRKLQERGAEKNRAAEAEREFLFGKLVQPSKKKQ